MASTAPSAFSGVFDPLTLRNISKTPINGVTVIDPQYGAIDDGQKDYFFATWTANGTALALYSGIIAITVANTGPGGAANVTFPGAGDNNANAPNQGWVGRTIAIDGAGVAGGTLVSTVTNVFQNNASGDIITVTLRDAALTTYTNASHKFACPCFVPSDAGKGVWLATGSSVAGQGNTGPSPAVWAPLSTTIATYVSPYSITLGNATTSGTITTQPGILIAWGTDNSAAIVAAGQAALAGGWRDLFFPGWTSPTSKGLFCAFGYYDNNFPFTPQDYNGSIVASALNWVTQGAETFVTPLGITYGALPADTTTSIGGAPWNAPPPSTPGVTFVASQSMPRCNTLTTINVMVVGDSWSAPDPTGDGNAVYSMFFKEFQRQNPAKKINVVCVSTSGLTWQQMASSITGLSTMSVGGATVTPDLVALFITGDNDASVIYRADIQFVINTIRSWSTTNGYPPDIMMITGTSRRSAELGSAGGYDYAQIRMEYDIGLQRGVAKSNNIPLLDIDPFSCECIVGWSSVNMVLRHVPALSSGTATLTAPYVLPYLCRDFLIALELVSATGSGFWSTAHTLQMSLSGKPDNRMIFSVDASNNLNVMVTTWGYTVLTPCTLANGSAALTTSGQTTIAVGTGSASGAASFYPNYEIGVNNAVFTSPMVGNCLYMRGSNYNNADYRSFVYGYTNANIIFVMDSSLAGVSSTNSFWGGQMFLPGDGVAGIDCIVAGAGTVAHPLTGANSLVTTVASVSTKFSVTLAAPNSQSSIAGSVKMFVGKISLAPTYNTAIAAGSDGAANPVLVVEKKGSYIKVSYVLGGQNLTAMQAALRNFAIPIWEGEVECFGGPFFPKFWAENSVTIQPVYVWADQRDLKSRRMTQREAFGTQDSLPSYPLGGDGAHPSHKFLNLIAELAATQRLALSTNYTNNNGSAIPTTGQTVTVPANQAFTAINPAGALAALTVTLPSVFTQGGVAQIIISQAVTSLTINAPSGFSIVGAAVSSATTAANVVFSYRLEGTTWYRVL